MKILGTLERAQLESLTTGTEPAAAVIGRMWWNTTTGFMRVDTGSALKTLVDENSTQAISGKSLSTITLTDGLICTQIATPSNPSAGFNKIYVKPDNIAYVLSSSGVETSLVSGLDSVAIKTANYTLVSTDKHIRADATAGAITMTLPTASSGLKFVIKKIDSSVNSVTIATSGGNTIDGSTTKIITSQYTSISLIGVSATEWDIQ